MTSAKDIDAAPQRNYSEQGESRHKGLILKDTGAAFASASLIGTFLFGYQGARDAPRGARFAGAVETVQQKGLKWSGTAAMWAFAFSASRHILYALRGKEDYYTFGTSTMMAAAMSSARKGLKRAGKDAVIAGVASFSCIGLYVALDYCRSQLLEAAPASGERDSRRKNEPTLVDEEKWTEPDFDLPLE